MAMLNSMITRATPLLPALLLSACAMLQNDSAPPADALISGDWDRAVARSTDVEALGERYLQLTLAMNPVSGVSRGRHGTARDATLYDRSLPDIRPQALQQDMARLQSIEAALSAIDPAALSEADRADQRILLSKIRLDQLELGTLGAARNPLNYVGTLGSAYSGLLLREFAPLEQRLRSLGARCASTPAYLAQVQRNLGPADVRPTAVQKQLVGPRIAGMTAETGMLRKTVPDLAATADMDTADRDRIVSQCAAAADALTAFGTWFADTVQPRPDAPWRLGADLYAQKYALYMDYPLDPAELLAEAEKALDDRYARLIETARTIHDAYLAEAIRTGRVRPAAQLGDDAVARNVLAEMSEDRPTVDSLIEDSYALADSIIGFVEREDLLDLPPATKLRIEPIPPHLSGYAVAMIQTAPPFEPHLDSVWFWDLPLLSQSEGFLKEYNRAALAEVYIHEGVPGHFVQLEYSNRADRLVPKVFWNGPMVEGWASYIQSQLVDAGYTVYPNHPQGHELQQIANLKLQLRAIINAIIDIRLHTTDWPAEQAVALMTGKGFQEEAEARGKLTRAKLSSVQLSSYFAGDHAIREILAEYRARKGDDFRWKTFNEKLLGAGSPPMDIVRERMLAADDAATADSRWRERTFY